MMGGSDRGPSPPASRAGDDREARLRALAPFLRDFARFCALLKVIDQETGARIPMRLTGIQRKLAHNRSKRDVVLKARKVWLTSIECARDLFWFVTRRGASVVIVVQTQQKHETLQTVSRMMQVFLQSLREHLDVRLDVENQYEWAIHNRDASLRIVEAGASMKTAEKGGRGPAVNRLHCSETAYWEHGQETVAAIINSMTAEDAEVSIESTPHGQSGYFYDLWTQAVEGKGFKPHFYPWYEHDRNRIALEPGEVIVPEGALQDIESALLERGLVQPDQIKWLRRKFNIDLAQSLDRLNEDFPSDPDTCFLASGRCFFDLKLIAADLLRCKPPLPLKPDDDERGMLRIWAHPKRGSSYVIGGDPAEGMGDPSGALVYEKGTGEHVATLHGQMDEWSFGEALIRLSKRYNDAKVAIERENHGHSVIWAFRKLGASRLLYMHADGKHGWPENVATRPVMLDGFAKAYRRREMKTNDRMLLGEMKTFVVNANGKAEADKKKHDDLVMAGGIGWHVATSSQAAVEGGDVYTGVSAEDRSAGYD
jgi:hypothetical protein